jgi:hypothetical protein
VALALVAQTTAGGCSGHPQVAPLPGASARSRDNHPPAADPYPDPTATLVACLDGSCAPGRRARVPGRPLNVLVLSGGGKYGAYTAGVLCGWTAHGTRPPFDVVTGISSGALTAVYAFLGPKYDQQMAAAYTAIRPTDLFRLRPVRGLLTHGALASSRPLEELIARELHPEAMADLRQAHAEGRRLFVATGDLTSLRPAIWDLGAVATSGRPDADALVRKILLAACSIPGYVPPVEFEVEVDGVRGTELHGDAGNIIQAFVRTASGLPAGSNVYVLAAGKCYRDPLAAKPRVLELLGATVSSTLYALFRGDVMKVYALCAATGSHFHLVAMSPDVRVQTGSMTFDTAEMRQLFTEGYVTSSPGIAWRTTPPAETLTPRTGLEFVTPQPLPAPPAAR